MNESVKNTALLNQAGIQNKVIPTKSVTMRNWEMLEFEKELETSRLEAENAAHGTKPEQPSESNEEPKNPNSVDEPINDLKVMQKRYSDLQSDRDKKLAEANKKINEANQKALDAENKFKESQKSKQKYPTSEEELEQWCKEFPPLLPIIQTIALKATEDSNSELLSKIKDLEDFKKAYANEKGKAELLRFHPDADDFDNGGSKNAEFIAWYNDQEPEIQHLVDSGEPKKIAKALTIFKKDLGIVTKTVKDLQKEASTAITVGPTPTSVPKEQKIWYESEVQKMKTKEYAKYQNEIEIARSEGRYVKDISG